MSARRFTACGYPTECGVAAAFADVNSRGRESRVTQSDRPAIVCQVVVGDGKVVGDLFDDRLTVVVCDRVVVVSGVRVVGVGPDARPPVVMNIVTLDGHAICRPELEATLVAVSGNRAAVGVPICYRYWIVPGPANCRVAEQALKIAGVVVADLVVCDRDVVGTTGQRSFYSDQTGVIHYQLAGGTPTVADLPL